MEWFWGKSAMVTVRRAAWATVGRQLAADGAAVVAIDHDRPAPGGASADDPAITLFSEPAVVSLAERVTARPATVELLVNNVEIDTSQGLCGNRSRREHPG